MVMQPLQTRLSCTRDVVQAVIHKAGSSGIQPMRLAQGQKGRWVWLPSTEFMRIMNGLKRCSKGSQQPVFLQSMLELVSVEGIRVAE